MENTKIITTAPNDTVKNIVNNGEVCPHVFFLLTNNKNLENTQKMSSLTVTGRITGCCRNVRLSTLIAFDLFLPMKTVT